MDSTKLTVRVSRDRLAKAKSFAKEHKTSLSRLINEFLGRLPEPEGMPLSKTVTELSGSLPENIAVDDYKRYLEQKYLE